MENGEKEKENGEKTTSAGGKYTRARRGGKKEKEKEKSNIWGRREKRKCMEEYWVSEYGIGGGKRKWNVFCR